MSVEPFDAVDVIRIKRDGGVVPEAALRWLIDAYTRGYVSDAQMASFAMAIFQRGMERDEIRVLTDAMIASGERMSFASLGKRTVDKHSTGGVGDKITLTGRLQSRAYQKQMPDGSVIEKTAYEVSVGHLELLDGAHNADPAQAHPAHAFHAEAAQPQ